MLAKTVHIAGGRMTLPKFPDIFHNFIHRNRYATTIEEWRKQMIEKLEKRLEFWEEDKYDPRCAAEYREVIFKILEEVLESLHK